MNLEIEINATAENHARLTAVLDKYPFWINESFGHREAKGYKEQYLCQFAGNFRFCVNIYPHESMLLRERILKNVGGPLGVPHRHLYPHLPEEQILDVYHEIRKAEKGE